MAKADLHVHSQASDRPCEWVMQKIGTAESYTTPEEVYRMAKAKGMDYVTLTDHNEIKGAELLVATHPDDTFISVESTVTFPEDNCKIHLLIYDITREIFEAIDRKRHNVYELREFLVENRILHSVAHPLFPVNNKLTVTHIEKLILLFNTFEGLNGSRTVMNNATWMAIIEHLGPHHLEQLSHRHGIKPHGSTPWIKHCTSGSDDHAGLFIGMNATVAPGRTVREYLASIAWGQSIIEGRQNDFKGLAFTALKIAWEFGQHHGNGGTNDGLAALAGSLIFNDKKLGAKNWLTLQQVKLSKNPAAIPFRRFLTTLYGLASKRKNIPIDTYHDSVFRAAGALIDEIVAEHLGSLQKEISSGNTLSLFSRLSSFLLCAGIAGPFIAAFRHFHVHRDLHRQCAERFLGNNYAASGQKKSLWFSDTLHEINGVSETIKKAGHAAHVGNRRLTIVVSVPSDQINESLPPNMLNLPYIHTLKPDIYPTITIRVPSFLSAIDLIWREQPDQIIISTPGPVGIIGLIAAKLLGVPCTIIYHTDFTRQVERFIGDELASSMTEKAINFFFSQADEIRVPTRHYMRLLAQRGLDEKKMVVLRRGIDRAIFKYDQDSRWRIRKQYGMEDHPVLLYAGRMGREKSLDFLVETYKKISPRRSDIRLVMAGDGPELDRLKQQLSSFPHAYFIGRVPHTELADWYSAADLFLFPSVTDTMGMAVMEAQACGLPALVTDVGGPQELVTHLETGMVLKAHDTLVWVETVLHFAEMMEKRPEAFLEMRLKAQKRAEDHPSWIAMVDDLMHTVSGFRKPPVATAAAMPEHAGFLTLDLAEA